MDIKNRSKEFAVGFVKQAEINYRAILGEMAGGGAAGALMGGLLGGTINTTRGFIARSHIPEVVAAAAGKKSKLKVGLSLLKDKLFGPEVTDKYRLKDIVKDFGKGALVGSGIGGVAGAAYGPIPHVTKAINYAMLLDKLRGKELEVAQALADKVGYKGLSFLDGVRNGVYDVGSPALRAAKGVYNVGKPMLRATLGTSPDFLSNVYDVVKIFM